MVILDDLRGQEVQRWLKGQYGYNSYVLRCSETKYSGYNQFWSSKASTTAFGGLLGRLPRPKVKSRTLSFIMIIRRKPSHFANMSMV